LSLNLVASALKSAKLDEPETDWGKTMSNRFTQYILIAMALGIVMGTLVFNYLPEYRADIASSVNLLAVIFLRLIKMIIAPLVFATLVGGIAHMGTGSKLGRIFAKTMGWFISASFVSLLLGLVMVNLLQPGDNFPGTLPDKAQSTGLPVSAFSLEKFLTHLIPTSIADAMAQNEILQIVVFAVFFSVAMGALPERSKQILSLIDDLGHIMLKVTGYVMLFAPIAVWAAITATVSKNGLLVLWKLIVFMGGFYVSLLILWGILVTVGFVVIGPRYAHLLRLIREPLMIAFSTASSEAAYPKTLEGLNRFGASSRISSFVLPLGYSFNLDGTMMYCTFASIFIAQTYKIDMPLATQLAMLATLMITSKGVAGVPRASLVVIASTLSQFGIPEAGLLMIMGIDTFLDMGRSATNVIGNSLATAVVAKWEGELAPEHALGPDDVVPPDMIPGEIPAMAGH
jgi:Na+/H+-dicarboxylate symporter